MDGISDEEFKRFCNNIGINADDSKHVKANSDFSYEKLTASNAEKPKEIVYDTENDITTLVYENYNILIIR